MIAEMWGDMGRYDVVDTASMRPRSYDRGNKGNMGPVQESDASFNEAAIL